MTIIAGIPIPSNSPIFLAVVGIHVLLGLACTITEIVAMLTVKGGGRHSDFGTIYYWCLSAAFVTAFGAHLTALRHIPSTRNECDFDAFMRISVNLFCSAELYQLFAFSSLSKRMMTKRFGAVPSKAVILSVRLMY